MFKIKNILLPTDFSKLSFSAAEYATELAEKYGAKIHVLNVLEKAPPILTIRSLDLSQDKILKEIENIAKKSLSEMVERIRRIKNLEIIPVLRKGNDYEQIIKYSQDKKIDLIVIATHGRTGIMRTLIGSVAEKVIRFSKIPVLVITPKIKNN